MTHYRSSIPKTARGRVTATYVTGPRKYLVECVLHGKIAGIRYFHETGGLLSEHPLKNGVIDGVEYFFETPGRVTSAEPYSNGLPHGTARQWAEDGRLIGTYTMRHGTGIDLWWISFENGSTYLSEVRYLRAGKRHGFEWWLNEDGRSVWRESHFRDGRMHGIERSWNGQGRLRRGYPRYWVDDVRVTKRQYVRARVGDAALPPFREPDNRPQRRFPSEAVMRRS